MLQQSTPPQRLIVALSGASGALYGIRLLEILREFTSVETHLIISRAAQQTITLETDYSVSKVVSLAQVHYSVKDLAATISSGSFQTLGMVVLPCSIKTLSAIAHSYSCDLISRAADVTLKERRHLILAVRETPLHCGHLHLLQQVATMGAVVMPPVPAFYHRPKTISDIVDQTLNRILDQLDIQLPVDLFPRWHSP